MKKEWTKKGREKYAAFQSKAHLAALCGVSRQSLSGYAHAKKGEKKAVQTPKNVALTLAASLGIGVENFGQKKEAKG